MPIDPKEKPSLMSGYSAAMGTAFELVATTGVGVFLGWLLDNLFNTRLIFVFILGLMGMAAGVLRLYRTWVK